MKNTNIDTSLQKLSQIAEWFENQEEVQVEEGMAKVKEAAVLIVESKKRLAEIENEFEEIKKEIDPAFSEKEPMVIEETESITIVTKEEKTNDSSDIPF